MWNIGDVRDIGTRRRLSEEEVKMYMELIEQNLSWELAKQELWRSCSSLGDSGTKEKEENIQRAILVQGVDVV
jgi:hypothetical protein